ncbi:hypothetical protein TGPRC2_205230 [Toxoplasma gondii TgCatPRC2]|uniref:Uncharacterized protein n=4 Tax=Toxoplasma gondii TaxID=5811 RepID=A0A151HAF0_TOXGO|nr:hypothetical protein TGME49_205230 [Toxoplasma gondii ME49]EPT29992.1 hypothetical protein TGME49_205230 [Toxoplasma gondii ME49]KYF44417.1 hypothetical protein TGARI_205230 [Toxoplasma gondii ARI]KYK66326.1 hypothetical protein TGPRC2_205230 [Toxoplasma gondii TgCatPRC2]PIM02420.1 hypothetical protein TGCOUG_205230 [Toxoplasma gondii COUG]|eukprot:XP_018637286.1 hypothetical protein TGME49_205230 [Toxoplasma gondii ME49]
MELVQKRETRKTEFPLILAPLLTVEECVHDFLTHGGVDIRQCHTALSPPSGSIKRNQIEKRGRRTYRPNYSVQASIRNETTKVNVMIYVRLFKKEANHCRGNLRVIHT